MLLLVADLSAQPHAQQAPVRDRHSLSFAARRVRTCADLPVIYGALYSCSCATQETVVDKLFLDSMLDLKVP